MLRELRTLIALAQHGTITAAANHIGLTQAAASAQIQRLEEQLKTRLLDRSGRHVRLNEAGIEVVSKGEHILHLCDELQKIQSRSGLRGRLGLGAVQSMQRQYLPNVLQDLIKAHPDISAHLELGGSLALLTAVDQSRLDAAVVVKPFFALPPELGWVPLLREPFKVICPAHEASEDWRQILTTLPFIRYDSASFGGRMVDRFLQHQRLAPKCHVESQDVDAILEMVASGIGAALVPIREPMRHQGRIRVMDLGSDQFYREVGLVLPPIQRRTELLGEFVRITCRHMRASPFAHPLLDGAEPPPHPPSTAS